ncbi:hypothetical protein CHLRE_10g461575v5 [Chlamydomonas reinhardtii]|uniref:Uncharacterized protein n=1 Tax=Chlamydomonas reinhardtii TaxID=3055 RepID=A0A2K3DBX7_CHLRE|nr:uncharacterized protein CHLRE_10g461575v5 [Chlamydomonas reinhardtii]PNW78032.1 hypothetical protein CHLRE_10g461575v5 [Chlamydomonas reinhardtii]
MQSRPRSSDLAARASQQHSLQRCSQTSTQHLAASPSAVAALARLASSVQCLGHRRFVVARPQPQTPRNVKVCASWTWRHPTDSIFQELEQQVGQVVLGGGGKVPAQATAESKKLKKQLLRFDAIRGLQVGQIVDCEVHGCASRTKPRGLRATFPVACLPGIMDNIRLLGYLHGGSVSRDNVQQSAHTPRGLAPAAMAPCHCHCHGICDVCLELL